MAGSCVCGGRGLWLCMVSEVSGLSLLDDVCFFELEAMHHLNTGRIQ